MDEIHFNVMTMMLIYYWMTKKYLFYYYDVNWYYCVVFGITHYFKPINIPTNCTLPTGIYTDGCVRRYISMPMGTVHLLTNTVHSVHYIQVYWWNVSVSIF